MKEKKIICGLLRETDTHLGETALKKMSLPPYWKGVYSKRSEFAHFGDFVDRKECGKLSPLYIFMAYL